MAVDDPLPGSAKGTTLVGWSKTASDPSPFSGTVQQSILTGEMYAINIDGISAAEIDVTALNDAAKRYILGTRDGGTITVRSFVTPSGIPLPVTGDSTPRNYRLHFPRKRYDPLDPESNQAHRRRTSWRSSGVCGISDGAGTASSRYSMIAWLSASRLPR